MIFTKASLENSKALDVFFDSVDTGIIEFFLQYYVIPSIFLYVSWKNILPLI